MAFRALLFSKNTETNAAMETACDSTGIRVEVCSDIFTAIEKGKTQAFSCVIADWADQPEASFLLKRARESAPSRVTVAIAIVDRDPKPAELRDNRLDFLIYRPISAGEAEAVLAKACQQMQPVSVENAEEPPGQADASSEGASTAVRSMRASVVPSIVAIRAVPCLRAIIKNLSPRSSTGRFTVCDSASLGHRVARQLSQNIAVDKRYQTKVKVIVRNITPEARSSSTRIFVWPNQAACEHSGLASRRLAMPIRFLRPQTLSALFFSVFLASMLLALATPLWAQKDAGAIVGLVRDPSGAVVTGAKVTVTDVDRGIQLTLSTNGAGEYVASPLRIGRYTVTVEKQGFKKAMAGPVQVNIQDRIAVDLKLDPGMTTEVVTVTGEAPQLETETSEIGQLVDQRRINALPLNGRNYAQLALLGAGVSPAEPGARDEGGFGFSSNGARSLQNNFLLDGIDNNSNLPDLLNETNFVIQPPVDALQEFKVESNAYSAEFGRGNGAIINAVIKSGTNGLHGSLWEFLRNDKLDGRNYFDDATKATPPYKQNQFGGTFGGPVVIPHLYDGRNRTFFFVDYEGLRIRQAQTQTALVPSQNERLGNFSEILTNQQVFNGDGIKPVLDCSGNPTFVGEIFDTRLTKPTQLPGINDTGLCGVPFTVNGVLNMIPTTPNQTGGGFLDPLAARLALLYPPPGPLQANTGNNFLSNPVLKETRTNFDVRVDQKFNDYNFAFFRFSYEDQPRSIPGTFPGVADGGGFFSGDEENSYRSFATSWTHIFRPQLTNEFRLGYNRINSRRLQLFANTDVSGQIRFPGVPFAPGLGGLPQLTFNEDGSAPQLGSPTFLPSKELQNSYTLSDNLTWVKGAHSLKFGTELRHEEFTIFQPDAARGM